MRISVVVTVDVDREGWDDEYHCGTGRGAVRANVIDYIKTSVQTMIGPDDTNAVRSVSIRPITRKP